MVVEVELHDFNPSRQVDFHFLCESYLHRLQVGADFQVTREGEEEQNSEEDETEVLKKCPHAEKTCVLHSHITPSDF